MPEHPDWVESFDGGCCEFSDFTGAQSGLYSEQGAIQANVAGSVQHYKCGGWVHQCEALLLTGMLDHLGTDLELMV